MRKFPSLAVLVSLWAMVGVAQEIRSGVWASSATQALPAAIPTSGYQIYMVGEQHGLDENASFQLLYLRQLHAASGLRDVALEEDSVYEGAAQAYVDGKSDSLAGALCLRADVLAGLRKFNSELPEAERVRVHLTDIDSPASAIRQHLQDLQARIVASGQPGAGRLAIPSASAMKRSGLNAVTKLREFPIDAQMQSELRTIEHSIRANQQGFEVGIGQPKGSPYLEDREQAIASNIADVLRQAPSLLMLYGADHVSRTIRKDGGMNRNQPLAPVALRLEREGFIVYSVVTYPLGGKLSWRGAQSTLPWTAQDGHLASGETLDRLLAASPEARSFFVDLARERVRLPSQDVSALQVDGFLLFPAANPLPDRCKLP